MRHYTSTLQIDVTSPTEATSRCYYQVITAKGADHWGRYVDAFTVVDGKWRFSHRKVSVDGRMAGGFAAGR
jgi:predicted peroxiredoxin